jgi:hypothetical protein
MPETSASAQRLFEAVNRETPAPDRNRLRDRWKLSHLLRAFAALAAMILMVIAIAI